MKIKLPTIGTYNLPKFKTLVKKNLESMFLIFMALLVLLLVQTFNLIKEQRKNNFFDILNNLYFQKTLNAFIDNLEPRYINIEHKISSGESFNSILKNMKYL